MKAIVLLSGGLDSAVNLAWACREGEAVLALTFAYGQRAAEREKEAARRLAAYYGVPWQVVELPFLAEITRTALVNREKEVPVPAELSGEEAERTARAVWVPNRNGLFINIAAAFAESLGADAIVVGFNREEGTTFPDNTPEFMEACNRALTFSTLNRPRVVSYTVDMDKAQIGMAARRLGVPLRMIWSCYHGGEEQCGRCESCQRLKRALAAVEQEGEG
ncbi:MAG: 7-cyano-7-deazaguanine synthase [Eubacteriales bacterium]|nr:7-cyano-7-deazaguanine synthase [Eubacteriales bacterium]